MPELIFMATHNDATVPDAREVCRSLAGAPLKYIGVKDVGLDPDEFVALVHDIHVGGRFAMLEIVSDERDDELRSVEFGLAAGVDFLLGGTHVSDVAPMLRGTSTRYLPFAGRVTGHPVRLEGTVEEIAANARTLTATDRVSGVDLLAYRHSTDPEGAMQAVLEAVDAPVVVAGSIDGPERIRRITKLGPWAFTVGSAIFEGRFGRPGASVRDQVEAIAELVGSSAGAQES